MSSTRSRPSKLPASNPFLRRRRADPRRLGLPSRAPRAVGLCRPHRRRPHGRRDGRLRLRRQRGDHHFTGVNWGRDLPEPALADLRNVVAGDPRPDGKGTLESPRGIEVGHIFQLRTKYAGDELRPSSTSRAKSRSWRWAATASACRASSAPPSSRTTTPAASSARRHGALPGRHRAGWLRQVRSRARRRRPLYAELTAAGIDASSTTATSVLGSLLADNELVGIPHRW